MHAHSHIHVQRHEIQPRFHDEIERHFIILQRILKLTDALFQIRLQVDEALDDCDKLLLRI